MYNPIIDFTNILYPGEIIIQMYPIPGLVDVFPNYYITNYGRIFSTYGYKTTQMLREMSATFNASNYLCVRLQGPNSIGGKSYQLARLVLFYFNGSLPDNVKDLEANHKNRNKCDNSIMNLEWTTHQENEKHYSDNYTGNRVVSEEKLNKAVDLLMAGYSVHDVAYMVDLNVCNVSSIRQGKFIEHKKHEERKDLRSNIIGPELNLEIYKEIQNGYTYEEIATKYGISIETVKSIERIVKIYKED